MAYTKLTARRWIQLLKDKAYKSASSAKKGIGRIDWPAEAKELGRDIIDAHYAGKKITEADIKALEKLVPDVEEEEPKPRPEKQRVSKSNGRSHPTPARTPVITPLLDAPKGLVEMHELKLAAEVVGKLTTTYGEIFELCEGAQEKGLDGSYAAAVVESIPALITTADRLRDRALRASEKFVDKSFLEKVEETLEKVTEEQQQLFDKAKPKDPFKPGATN